MGVQYLYNIIRYNNNNKYTTVYDKSINFEEIIDLSIQNILILDYPSFIFNCILNINDKEKRFLNSLGSIDIIKNLFYNKIKYLTQDLNFKLIFFKDSKYSAFRNPNEFDIKENECIYHFYNLTNYLKSIDNNKIQITRSPLISMILNDILYENNIEIINSEFEADFSASLYCKKLNNNFINNNKIERAYCYSTDSDFILMKDCMLLHPDELNNIEINNNKIKINVYTRSKAYRKLCFHNEISFVKACIHYGNDFTKHLSFASKMEYIFNVYRTNKNPTVRYKNKYEEDSFKFSLAFYEHDEKTLRYLFNKYKKLKNEHLVNFFLPFNFNKTFEEKYSNLSIELIQSRDFFNDALEFFIIPKENDNDTSIKLNIVTSTIYNPKTRINKFTINEFILSCNDSLINALKNFRNITYNNNLNSINYEKIDINIIYYIFSYQYTLIKLKKKLKEKFHINFNFHHEFNIENILNLI